MTFQRKLVEMGEWAASALMLAGGELDNNVSLAASTGTNGTSSGSSTNAYVISKDVTFITTTTSSTAGNAAILPSNKGSAYLTVFNNTANTAFVFAPVGGSINNYAAAGMQTNAGTDFHGAFQVGANKSASFMSPDGVSWLAQHAG